MPRHARGDAAFIATALGDIARAKGMSQVDMTRGCPGKASIKHCLEKEAPASIQFLKY